MSISPNWTVRYAAGMGSLVVGGFWLAALMLSFDADFGRGGLVAKGVGVFGLGVSLCAATILLATGE